MITNEQHKKRIKCAECGNPNGPDYYKIEKKIYCGDCLYWMNVRKESIFYKNETLEPENKSN